MICTESELNLCIEKCMVSDVVAVDTEFVWERTYFPILGLIQLATEDETFLIDPLAFDDLSALAELMSSKKTVKILHDALQDLQIIQRATGVLPANVFDTRAAAGFADNQCTLSLSALLELLVDIKLPKTESRTNWLQRPLSDKQIDYAIDDVKYMPEAYHKLVQMMKDNGTIDWFQEEMASLEADKHYAEELAEKKQLNRIMGSSRFKPNQLAIMQELINWREKVARKKDKPRNFIIDTNVLIDIAMKTPKTPAQLAKIKSVPQFCQKYQADAITKAVKSGLQRAPEDCPHAFHLNLDRKQLRKMSDRILVFARSKAADLKIDPQLVTSRKEVESYINKHFAPNANTSSSRLTKGWRKEFFKELGPLIEEN